MDSQEENDQEQQQQYEDMEQQDQQEEMDVNQDDQQQLQEQEIAQQNNANEEEEQQQQQQGQEKYEEKQIQEQQQQQQEEDQQKQQLNQNQQQQQDVEGKEIGNDQQQNQNNNSQNQNEAAQEEYKFQNQQLQQQQEPQDQYEEQQQQQIGSQNLVQQQQQEQELQQQQDLDQIQEQQQEQMIGEQIGKKIYQTDIKNIYILESCFQLESGEISRIKVEVTKNNYSKPYLGGFKNIKNGLVYHHGFAQTDQIARDHKLKYHRDTQTYDYCTISTKVSRECGTQMEREGLFIDKRPDKPVIPNEYFSSEMWEERREEAALFIQRVVRGMLARTITFYLKEEKKKQRRDQLENEETFRKNAEVKHKKEIERRMHPRSKEDFNILFDELELWRTNEIQKIKENINLSEEDRRMALKQVLDKETELLQTIDRLKIIANKENKEEKIYQFLKQMSDPKKWLRTDGRFTEVHTPFTIRAKELMDIYMGLKMKKVTIDERLDILLNTKWTVNQYDKEKQNYELIREIQELIDREADMINRGRSETSLEGLRKRLCNLFLQFIETPDFNPEAARFQKIPFELLLSNQTRGTGYDKTQTQKQ